MVLGAKLGGSLCNQPDAVAVPLISQAVNYLTAENPPAPYYVAKHGNGAEVGMEAAFHEWATCSTVACLSTQATGYVASALVLLTFSMRSMRLLRITGIISNLVFILYALLAHLPPVLILHSILLPVNLWRLMQLQTQTQAGVTLEEEAQPAT